MIASPCWAQAGAAAIPYRPASDGASPDPQQWLLVVGACAVLLAAMVFLLRRYGSRFTQVAGAGKRVRVLERSVITGNVQLLVIEYDARRMLLSVSPTGVACLRDDERIDARPAGSRAGQP